MKKSLSKILAVTFLVVAMFISVLPLTSFAASSSFIIVEDSESGNYIIYIEGLSGESFEFAFSNTKDESLNYIASISDSEENQVAYIDSTLYTTYFGSETTYLWVKTEDGETVVKGEVISISDARLISDLKTIETLTNVIDVKTDAEDEKIIIDGEEGDVYTYQMYALSSSEDYTELLSLIEELNSYGTDADIFQVLNSYIKIYDLYNVLLQDVEENDWAETTDLEIAKPYGAEEGTKYILWLKDEEGNVDIQFLTAYETTVVITSEDEITTVETVTEEVEKEVEVETALPVTYDETTMLWIGLGIIAIAIAIVIAYKIKTREND